MNEPQPPLIMRAVLGRADERRWHEAIHAAEHRGQLETVAVAPEEAARKRIRLRTDRGRDVALALPRDQSLSDGAVLHASPDLVIVTRIDAGPRLRLTPHDEAAALRLGYFCGNLHWKADFVGGAIEIVMDGPEEGFRARLRDAADYCAFDVERLAGP